MKKCIIAAALLLALCSTNVRSQTTTVVEEYHIPIFSVFSPIDGIRLHHLAFNYGLVAEVFDSLQHVVSPGNYDMVFEKIRTYDSNGIFLRTYLRFKEVIAQQYPIINGCQYSIPCYTEYAGGANIIIYSMLGELAHDPLVTSFLQGYFFGKQLDYGMCYTITVADSLDPHTDDRTIVFVSVSCENYIKTIRK